MPINALISQEEKNIIADIREIAFGEIYSLGHEPHHQMQSVPLSSKELNLLLALREHKYIGKVIIHDNEPTAGEINGITARGRKYLKKLRF